MREFQKFLPTGFSEPPKTVVEVLKAGKAVLQDEQNWAKGDWFQNHDPKLDPENAYCNHWQVCAEGAIGIVTLGAFRDRKDGRWEFATSSYGNQEDWDLFSGAVSELEDVLPESRPMPACGDVHCDECEVEETEITSVPEFNDNNTTTHKMVMDVFDQAIANAEEKEKALV